MIGAGGATGLLEVYLQNGEVQSVLAFSNPDPVILDSPELSSVKSLGASLSVS